MCTVRACVASAAANLRSTPLIDRLMKRTEMAAARPPETAREKKERQTMEERLGKDKGERERAEGQSGKGKVA